MARLTETQRARARASRSNPTEAEKALWHRLTQPPFDRFHFRRQHPVAQYVLDFACLRTCLAVEVDGGQHGGDADQVRDQFLARKGWRTLRFWNNDILGNTEGVAETIWQALCERCPHPDPPPRQGAGEGE